jgi:hypothetical protein
MPIAWHNAQADTWGGLAPGGRRLVIEYGACPDKDRGWFWSARRQDRQPPQHCGWVDNQHDALALARESTKTIAGNNDTDAVLDSDAAKRKLKELTPPARPAPAPARARLPAPEPDLKSLRAAMLASHPDRGGNGPDFIRAREEYLQALAAAGKK